MVLTARHAHELSRIAARHGAIGVEALPGGRVRVEVDRRHVVVAVALGPDGRPVWSSVLADPGGPAGGGSV